jgi:hypothetical protein
MKPWKGLLVGVVLVGCGSASAPNPNGGAGNTGSAGSTGTAGSTATAGSTGTAGSTATAGSTGTAGSTATAGSTGTAGSTASDGGATDAAATTDATTTTDAAAEAVTCHDELGNAEKIEAGKTYGEYAVETITLLGAPCGVYTFSVASPTAGHVDMKKSGDTTVVGADYGWQTTVSATDSAQFYKFHFAGYVDLTGRKAGSGTINLYDLDMSIFDGARVLVVP